jgi:N-acetylglutamate synthase-like GNAT family acetyltransferase
LDRKFEDSDIEAADLATRLGAKKLVFITHSQGVFETQRLVSELTIDEAERLIGSGIIKDGMKNKVQASIKACRSGVERVHIIYGEKGALLKELLTVQGSGTMIYRGQYFEIRPVNSADMSEIFELLNISNLNICPDLQQLETHLDGFYVHTTDQSVTGCMKLSLEGSDEIAELSHFVVSPEYDFMGIYFRMISRAIELAKEMGAKKLFLRPSKNIILVGVDPRFFQLGFRRIKLKIGTSSFAKSDDGEEVFLLDF